MSKRRPGTTGSRPCKGAFASENIHRTGPKISWPGHLGWAWARASTDFPPCIIPVIGDRGVSFLSEGKEAAPMMAIISRLFDIFKGHRLFEFFWHFLVGESRSPLAHGLLP